MKKKTNIVLLLIIFCFFLIEDSQANFQEKIINKYITIDTLAFDFTQKVGDKIEFGNCYIKYPLLMKCEYPKKKKSIISNGKKFAIIQKRYKKIYYYPLKKTPLFFLLKKENILSVVKNYEPIITNSNVIEYKLEDNNSNKINIFFDKKLLILSGWKTTDAYSNEVHFLLKNIKTNILIKNEVFKIPKEENL